MPDDPLDQPDPAAVPHASRREEIVGSGAVNLLLGAWLVASPFVLGYEDGDPVLSDVVSGLLVVTFALVRVAGAYWHAWLSWANTVVGIWVFGSAFWFAETATASWNEGLTGAAVVLLSVLSASATDAARRWKAP